jgi:hypothetical protein
MKTRPLLSSIESVGVELEGGFCFTCSQSIIQTYKEKLHVEVMGDWSVSVPIHCGTTRHPCFHDTEIQAWVKVEDLDTLFDFVSSLFSYGNFQQNATCGNHVHIAFKDKASVKRFETRQTWNEFTEKYKEHFRNNSKHVERLNGKWASSDWNMRFETKKTMINLGSLYNHSTLEFRPLAWFEDKVEAIESYTKLLKIIDEIAKL